MGRGLDCQSHMVNRKVIVSGAILGVAVGALWYNMARTSFTPHMALEVMRYADQGPDLAAELILRNSTRSTTVCRLQYSCVARGVYGATNYLCGPADYHVMPSGCVMAFVGPEALLLPKDTTNWEVGLSFRAATGRERLRSAILRTRLDQATRLRLIRFLAPTMPPSQPPADSWQQFRSGVVPVTPSPVTDGAYKMLPPTNRL